MDNNGEVGTGSQGEAQLDPGMQSLANMAGQMGQIGGEADGVATEAPAEAATETQETIEDKTEQEHDPEALYSKEYRERINAPTSNLFSKRRVIMERQFPALKPLSAEDTRRYANDEAYRREVDEARDQVPREVRQEHDLLGYMIGRLDGGISADLRPDDEWASSSPNNVPTEIDVEGYGPLVVTRWKERHSREDLARLRELHEKNSEIVDFSQESEVDVDSVPDELQDEIDSLRGELEELETADYDVFLPSGGNRPRAAEIQDRIYRITDGGNLSYETRKQLAQTRHEYQRRYLEALDASRLREVDRKISELQREKEEIAARQKRYESANFVSRLFRRVFGRGAAAREQSRVGYIDDEMRTLNSRAEELRERNSQR